jgi:hypothetical protein
VRATESLTAERLERYWTASKCRLDRWQRGLKAACDPARPAHVVERVPGLLEEILLSEVLTRVWAALVLAFDRRHGTSDVGPIVRSVYGGHQEARHRTMRLLLSETGLPIAEAVELNRVRRRAERWTDLLIGHLWEDEADGELAFDRRRAADFAADLREDRHTQSPHAWPLLFASLQAAFQQRLEPHSPNADLNEQIASGILGCFGPELFDGIGAVHSLWVVRLLAMTSDTQGLLADLLEMETPGPAPTGLKRF